MAIKLSLLHAVRRKLVKKRILDTREIIAQLHHHRLAVNVLIHQLLENLCSYELNYS